MYKEKHTLCLFLILCSVHPSQTERDDHRDIAIAITDHVKPNLAKNNSIYFWEMPHCTRQSRHFIRTIPSRLEVRFLFLLTFSSLSLPPFLASCPKGNALTKSPFCKQQNPHLQPQLAPTRPLPQRPNNVFGSLCRPRHLLHFVHPSPFPGRFTHIPTDPSELGFGASKLGLPV